MENLSLGGRLGVVRLVNCIWVCAITSFSSFCETPFCFEILWDFISFDFLVHFLGVNVQNGEEVGVKLVSAVWRHSLYIFELFLFFDSVFFPMGLGAFGNCSWWYYFQDLTLDILT